MLRAADGGATEGSGIDSEAAVTGGVMGSCISGVGLGASVSCAGLEVSTDCSWLTLLLAAMALSEADLVVLRLGVGAVTVPGTVCEFSTPGVGLRMSAFAPALERSTFGIALGASSSVAILAIPTSETVVETGTDRSSSAALFNAAELTTFCRTELSPAALAAFWCAAVESEKWRVFTLTSPV